MARSLFGSRVGLGLLALFLLPTLAYGGYSVADRWYQSSLLALEEEALRQEIAELRLRNLQLQTDLVHARGDSQIEAIAREVLSLVRPGDRPILLVGPPVALAPEPATRREAAPPPPKSTWRKLLDAMFGR